MASGGSDPEQLGETAFAAVANPEKEADGREKSITMAAIRPKSDMASLGSAKHTLSAVESALSSLTLRQSFGAHRNTKGASGRGEGRRLQLPPRLDEQVEDRGAASLPVGPPGAVQLLPPVYVPEMKLTLQEQISLYCDQILRNCQAKEANEALSKYLLEKLELKNEWIGIWRANPEIFFDKYEEDCISYVEILVEVIGKPRQNMSALLLASVRISEPFSTNFTKISRNLIDKVLEQLDYSVPLLAIYPTEGQDDVTCEIAQRLKIVRFFYDYLWRDWDDEENYVNYTVLIEERIKLYADIHNGSVPYPIGQRFLGTLEQYKNKRLELIEYQISIQDDPSVAEAVECWNRYYEVLMLCGLLNIWEDLRLRAHGPFFPRVLRRKKGLREFGKVVTHVVSKIMTAAMVKEYSSNTLLQQHNNLDAALDSCYCGDTVVIFPGEYQALGLAMLTDDIIIKGVGKKEEIIITSDPSSDSFVTSKAKNIKFIHLTLIQKESSDGIVVVESGHMTMEDCVLKCAGTGVSVLTTAALTMKDCEITGSQGPGVELYPGSAAILEGNKIHHCNTFKCTDGLQSTNGGINLKVLPAPVVKLSNNHIYKNNGYGIAIVEPDRKIINALNVMKGEEGARDKGEKDALARAIKDISLDIEDNTIEENGLGSIGMVFI